MVLFLCDVAIFVDFLLLFLMCLFGDPCRYCCFGGVYTRYVLLEAPILVCWSIGILVLLLVGHM